MVDRPDSLTQLFTDTDYKLITYTYKDYKQDIYALQTASTDYDLTGQIIWAAADILTRWLFDRGGPSICKAKTIIELGSGPGLCGLVSARLAKKVILSDYQDLVMELMEQNAKECNPSQDQCTITCAKLDWCMPDTYKELKCTDDSFLKDNEIDLIIGSDIVYWPSSIDPLVQVLSFLFKCYDKSEKRLELYFCYIERATQTHKLLLEALKNAGFIVESIDEDLAKSVDQSGFIYKVVKSK